jgi:ABC-type lipoprotein export system ATPase subunit/ABC-type antimicrobial peptide transport system permease subunit
MGAVAFVEDLVKNYQMEEVVVPALLGVSLEFEEGDFIALMGPSGSGKSTLLNLLGCLDRSTTGRYYLGGDDVSRMPDDQLSEVRSRYIGFIFQSYNLLPQYTVVENIEIPLLYQGVRLNEETRQRCITLAEMVGLGERLDHRPTQLSGGQQQRVAIARSLVNDPHIILADEPTGNLDSRTSEEIMRLLCKLNDAGKTIIMVTHEDDIASWAKRVVRMRDGRIETDVRNTHRPMAATAASDKTRAASLLPPVVHAVPHTEPTLATEPTPVFPEPSAPPVVASVEHHDAEPSPLKPMTGFSQVGSFWTKARSSFVLALRSLWLHKLRSFLSVLGVVIGTAAVIAQMGFSKGSMDETMADIKRQGTNNINIRSVKPSTDDATVTRRGWVVSYGLSMDDFERFKMLPDLEGIVPMRIFPQQVRYLEHMSNVRVVATTEDYSKINNLEDKDEYKIATGRFLHDARYHEGEGDDTRMRTVIVLGYHVAEDLFPFEEALGKEVVLNKDHYTVVGVIKRRTAMGNAGGTQGAEDFDSDVYIPFKTCQARFGEKMIIRQGASRSAEQVQLHQVTLKLKEMDQVRGTGEVVRQLMDKYHSAKNDWGVDVPLDKLEAAERAYTRALLLTMATALISVVVGGIGIMNIMLATVTERTREIGIRRALGAKRRDITSQFLVEAVVQTSIGGLFGIVTGVAILFGCPLVSWHVFGSRLPAGVDQLSLYISVGSALITGILFGWYPAFRASRLDPIEALRHV